MYEMRQEFEHVDFTIGPKFSHLDVLENLDRAGYVKPKQLVYKLEADGDIIHVFRVMRDGDEEKSTVMSVPAEALETLDYEEFFVTKLREHGLDGTIFHPTDHRGEPWNENVYVLAEKRRPYHIVLSDLWYLINQGQDYMDPADWARFKAVYDELEQHK